MFIRNVVTLEGQIFIIEGVDKATAVSHLTN